MNRWRLALIFLLTALAGGAALAQTSQPPAVLTFDSATNGMNTSIGPLEIPDATYRVTVTSAGRLTVSAVMISGDCGGIRLFDIDDGEATNGLTAYFVPHGCTARLVVNNAHTAWTLTFEPVDAEAAPSLTATEAATLTLRPSPRPTRTQTPVPFMGGDLGFYGYEYDSNPTIGPFEIPAGRYYALLLSDGPVKATMTLVSGSCPTGPLFDAEAGEAEFGLDLDFYSQGCTVLLSITNARDKDWAVSFNLRFLEPTESHITPTPLSFTANLLTFSGTQLPTNPTLGPVLFPAGDYNVSVLTDGALTVEIKPISGVCQAGTLLDFGVGEASNFARTNFRSEGCTALVAVSHMTTEIWIMSFSATLDPTPRPGSVPGGSTYRFDSDTDGLQGLLGPFDLPEGVYRITLTTEGYLSIDLDSVTGFCHGVGLYNLSSDDVNLTTEALIQSDGCNAIITVGNVNADSWSMMIEPIDPNATATRSPTVTPASTPRSPTAADGAAVACDAAAARDWLLTARNSVEDTTDFIHAGTNLSLLVSVMFDDLADIEAVDRPACADAAMNWTYYLYNTWVENVFCQAQNDLSCFREVEARARTYVDQAKATFDSLGAIAGLGTGELSTLTEDDIAFVIVRAPSGTPTPAGRRALPRIPSPTPTPSPRD